MRYSIPLPHARGRCAPPTECEIAPAPNNINDLFLYALFARIANQNGTTEFKTVYDQATNTIELEIPEDVLEFIESIGIQPRMQRFVQWLISAASLDIIKINETTNPPSAYIPGRPLTIAAINFAELVINDSSGIIDWNSGNKQYIKLTSDTVLTFTTPLGPTAMQLFLQQDSVGAHQATYPAGIKWPSGVQVVLTPTANAIDVMSIVFDGTNYYATMAKDFR